MKLMFAFDALKEMVMESLAAKLRSLGSLVFAKKIGKVSLA